MTCRARKAGRPRTIPGHVARPQAATLPTGLPAPLPSLAQGWADPSPVLPNRYAGSPYSAAQMAQLAGVMANMTARAARAAARWMPDEYLMWLSTDHFSEGG